MINPFEQEAANIYYGIVHVCVNLDMISVDDKAYKGVFNELWVVVANKRDL